VEQEEMNMHKTAGPGGPSIAAEAARLLKATALAGSFAMLAGAASAVELTLWAPTSFTPAAGLQAVADEYTDLYKRFEAANPDITLKYEVLPGGTEALQQVLTASTAGNLPDLAVLDGFWIARLVQTGKLQPLNDLWTEDSRSKFYKAAVDAVTFDGKVYAAWFYNAWRGLYYRKDELTKLGYDAPPSNWDDFLKLAEKAKQAGVSAVMFPGSATELTALHMLSMYWGLGGELVDDTGKPVFFDGKNREALEKVYSMYRELVEKGYMPVDVSTMDEAGIRPYFYSGEDLATAQSSSAVTQMYSDVPDLKGNLGAFNYPLPGGAQATPILVGWTYGIFTDDPERKAAAWKFIDFMLQPDNLGKMNAIAGQLPIVQSIWDQDFFKNDPLMQQFKGIFDSGGMRPRPPVPIYPTITAAWAQEMADVLAGNITPAQAVDTAKEAVMREYDRQSSR
jgi:multiple sugar transport system substrate-binding protein